MSEERLIEIESRLAYQDHTLNELNDVVTQQQATIMKLERLCLSMAERVSSLQEAFSEGENGDEKPPHY
tara:strand:+ start:10291 stop:10497 length:207 start_codon:yes stop_codon:yes gene_type:complete